MLYLSLKASGQFFISFFAFLSNGKEKVFIFLIPQMPLHSVGHQEKLHKEQMMQNHITAREGREKEARQEGGETNSKVLKISPPSSPSSSAKPCRGREPLPPSFCPGALRRTRAKAFGASHSAPALRCRGRQVPVREGKLSKAENRVGHPQTSAFKEVTAS